MNKGNIFDQDGKYINVLHPTYVASAAIYSEEERQKIKQLIKEGYYPHHTAIGVGNSTSKHWNLENYNGRYGNGYKLITTSTLSTNFNHITYFLKII